MLRKSWFLIVRCWLAALLALMLAPSAQASCSVWLDKAWFNEYYFGNDGKFLELYSNDKNFPASWQGWTVDVYDGVNQKMIPTVSFNNGTAFACTKTGNKTWVTHNSTANLSGNKGLVILRDNAGDYVDALAFDNTAPPAPWTSDTSNYLPALVTACPALASRLSSQAGTAGSSPNQANILKWSSQGNKDYSRQPDGLGSPWYVTSLTGSGTTYTTCTSNNANLTKTVNTTSVPPGGTVQFLITLFNASNSALSGTLTVVDPLPAGLSYVSAVSSNSADTISYNGSTATVSWTPANLGAASRTVLTLTATVPSTADIGTSYTNTASTTGTALGSRQQSDTVSFSVVAPTTRSFLISASTQTSCTAATTAQKPVVTLTAKDQLNGTGNTLTGYTGTATLGTSSPGNTANWQKLAANGTLTLTASGATYTFAASDNGVASFYLGDSVAETIDLTATDAISDYPNTMSGVFSAIQYTPGACSTLPALTVGNASVSEGNAGTSTLNFPVTLSAASAQAVSVNYVSFNVTASAGSDYQASSGTLTLPAGSTSASIPVTVYGDTVYEDNETLTLTLSNPVNATLAVGSGTGTLLNDDAPPLRAHYRMDEAAWSGSGSVLDSGATAYHGTAYGQALPAGSGYLPAYPSGSGSPSTCSYASFDGAASSYIALPGGLAALPVSGLGYTVSAWVKAGSASGSRRIVGNDDASQGWAITLNNGTLGFSKTGVSFNAASGGSYTATSIAGSTTLAQGAWYFVALTVDTAAQSVVLYAYSASTGATAPTVRVTASYTGSWTAPNASSTTTVGGSSGSSSNFVGAIDEVRIHDGPLAQATLETIRMETRACPGLHHLEILGSGSGVTCYPNTLSLRACADASCSALYTGGVSGTLTASTASGAPTVNWDGSTGGAAGAGFSIPSGSSSVSKNLQVSTAGTLDVGLINPSPTPASATLCDFGSPLCRFTASDVGFIVSDSATGGPFTVPTQRAGQPSSTLYLRAVQTSTTTGACTALLQGTQSVNLGYFCDDPAICSASNLMTVSAASSVTIPRNDGAVPLASGSTSGVSMVFDANGSAPFSLSFADVGSVRLYAAKTVTSAQGISTALSAATNAFVVKPYSLTVTGIKRSSDSLANPAPAGPDDNSASVFVRAGDGSLAANQFTATVTATTLAGAAAPNFGKEAAPEGIKLTPTRLAHADLSANGTLFVGSSGGGVVGGGLFAAGQASPGNLAWSEAGIMTLTPSIGDGDYLGAGDVTGAPSANIGRFIPDHFVVSGSTAFAAGCTAGDFSYMGQPFATPLAATIAARNALNTVTQNYSGAFATGLVSFRMENANSGTEIPNSRLAGQGAALWTAGQYALSATSFARGTGVDGPYDLLAIGARVDESNVAAGLRPTLKNRDADVATSTVCTPDVPGPGDCSSVTLVTTKLRHGRARLLNANGSELLDLPMTLRLEYWDGGQWRSNTLDSCTTLAPGNFAFAFGGTGNQLQACETYLPALSGSAPGFTLGLKKPGAGNGGWTDITLNLGATAAGSSCTAAGASGPSATTANQPWLQFNWGNATDPNPAARATFGVMRSGKVIHRREMY